MIISSLWKKLLASIFPGVDDDLPELIDEEHEPPEDNDDDQDSGDADLDDVSEEPEVKKRQPRREDTSRLDAAVDRAQRLEDDVAALKRNATPSADQKARSEEDRQLNDPNTDEMTKWQIRSNQTLRSAENTARQALNEAHDMRDQAKFLNGGIADPRRAKYADKIEKELVSLRSKGQNVDRETLYYYQLGKDIANGTLKAAPKKPTAQAAVPRGKSVAARSDVKASGRSKSASGARERLSNTQI